MDQVQEASTKSLVYFSTSLGVALYRVLSSPRVWTKSLRHCLAEMWEAARDKDVRGSVAKVRSRSSEIQSASKSSRLAGTAHSLTRHTVLLIYNYMMLS